MQIDLKWSFQFPCRFYIRIVVLLYCVSSSYNYFSFAFLDVFLFVSIESPSDLPSCTSALDITQTTHTHTRSIRDKKNLLVFFHPNPLYVEIITFRMKEWTAIAGEPTQHVSALQTAAFLLASFHFFKVYFGSFLNHPLPILIQLLFLSLLCVYCQNQLY